MMRFDVVSLYGLPHWPARVCQIRPEDGLNFISNVSKRSNCLASSMELDNSPTLAPQPTGKIITYDIDAPHVAARET